MKLLMFFCPEFSLRPYSRTVDSGPENPNPVQVKDAVLVFYHCEAEDQERRKQVLTKALKNIKWLANKFGSREVVLHSFNHLSSSKADPEFSSELAGNIRQRLENTGYEVQETPFGWMNEWWMHVAGESLAKVFKEL
ncbi:MAG: threonyl-tRNA synthetase editing domain-containing protein [Desulfohalobiaceae bacterium]